MAANEEQLLLLVWMRRRQKRKQAQERIYRRYWVHPLLAQRSSSGYFAKIFAELRSYPPKFFNFTRMSMETFDVLLEILRPRLSQMDTKLRRSISPEERLLVTLRFLATGQSYVSLHHYFLIGLTTVAQICRETCAVIWEELQPRVMPEPTEDLWQEIADEYWEKTQFPNCIGALDGKHVKLRKPPKSGSKYFNYKKYFSIVLLALADANQRFIFVDVGAYGSSGDSRIFRQSALGRKLHSGQLNLPPRKPLPGTEGPPLPPVIVADEAFGLSENLMRPYSGNRLTETKRIFNYRLSHARRMVECAFGICSGKWRILLSTIHLDVDNAVKAVLACCVLHNYVKQNESSLPESSPTAAGAGERVQFHDLRLAEHALHIRNAFADYFMTADGQLHWQSECI